MKRLTLDEIGRLAGVSRATVSRVVNDYPHISPVIRERVKAVIAETGFQPNMIARSLASDRSGIIGLVIPSAPRMVFGDPFFPSLIQGITQAANNLQLTLSLFLFHSKDEESRTIRSILNTGLLDGLIITADRKEDSFLPQIVEHGMPFILTGRPEHPETITFVDTDSVQGAYMATEHLIKLGCQRIATIASGQNTSGDDRLLGYRRALQAYNRPFEPELVGVGDYSMDSGTLAMRQLLLQKPDAVFVASDTMALGALRAIREAGMTVPEDIALVGFDDLPPAIQADPQLTTIEHPIERMGMIAVDLLVQRIRAPEGPPQQIILPARLIIRESCGYAEKVPRVS